MTTLVNSGSNAISAFFYGTLMHPKILKRVIGNDGSHLQICPAVLLDYTRHQVKYADYPGILPYSKGRTLFGRELDLEDRSVRGTMVIGLTNKDMSFLDVFEGDEYTRERVSVHPLGSLTPIPSMSSETEFSMVPANPPPLPDASTLTPAIEVDSYVYCDPANLWATLWSFDDFVKKNAWKWIGEVDGNGHYTEVEQRSQSWSAGYDN